MPYISLSRSDLRANTLVFTRIQENRAYPPFGNGILQALLYNLTSLPQSHRVVVPLVGAEPVTARRFSNMRALVALIVALGLTVTLAGRVFQDTVCSTTSVRSSATLQKVQHRDSDASRWAPPPATYVLLWGTERSSRLEPLEQAYFHLNSESLHNRPPPAS